MEQTHHEARFGISSLTSSISARQCSQERGIVISLKGHVSTHRQLKTKEGLVHLALKTKHTIFL